ncbi:DNA mismatch repair protein MutS [Candidatus Sulfidibacterium hydrothermale]|uniref:MutS-related protein n=1 Tax=Candidatus Sulfidibacterium hydrothermale TaxID=2875962 RepID=UPI001F0B0C90|nr:DNA mismatch repair protein MutS [Candidatus Sulfidibacterium hydrothermale]UBM63412.1 DNA mismatch repair protein MutS [Candidatus Sulfidibacterium hydrothermale]
MDLFHRKKKKIKAQIRQSFGQPKTEDFNFDAIGRYADRNSRKSFQKLSGKTLSDLNFNDLFQYCDRTSSRIGQQVLYDHMQHIPENRDEINTLEKWIERFENNEPLRTDLQYHLRKLADNDAYYVCDLFQRSFIRPPRWLPFAYVLGLTNLLALILLITNFNPVIMLVSTAITVTNAVFHYLNKKNIYVYTYSMRQLLFLDHTVNYLWKFDFLKRESSVVPKSIEIFHIIAGKTNFFRIDDYMRGDPFYILSTLSEIFKIYFLLEPIFLFRVFRQMKDHEKELQEVFAFTGKVDIALSIASLRAGLPYFCKPEIIADIKKMHFEDIYIPLIPDCVSNTLNINNKSILITGSNMSGKTTFIRMVGINTLMALTLNTSFARSFALPRLKLYSAILLNDDMMNDKSFYLEEVQTIKEMIEVSRQKEPHLFLLDEIYKGTNTIERVSGGKAVLSWLNRGNNLVFISTHDIELTELLKDEYDLYHFSEQVDNRNISFDYKIKTGMMKTRNAIKILEVNGYPPEIIAEAKEISYEMDKQRSHFEK